MKFQIEIEELLHKVVEVDAENVDEGITKVREQYRNEEIILNEDDYKGAEFREYKEV